MSTLDPLPASPARLSVPGPMRAQRFGLQEKFGLAFLLLLLMAAVNVAVLQGMVRRLDGVADTVDTAGRLRTLSQKIAFELASAWRSPQQSGAIEPSLDEYEQGLLALENGGQAFELASRRLPAELQPVVATLRGHWSAFRGLARRLHESHLLSQEQLEQLRGDSHRLLDGAQALVDALTRNASQTQTRMLTQLYGLFLVEALIFCVLVLLIRKRIIKPLRELARHHRELALGRYGHLLAFSSRDEIGELAAAFNYASTRIGELAEKSARDNEALSQTAAMFQGLAENAIVGIYIVQDERFAFANQRLAEMFGHERERMLASVGLLDLIDEADHGTVREQVHKRLSGEAPRSIYEARGRRTDGSRIDLEIYGAVMQLDGRPATIGAMLDVTTRRAQQQQRERQYVARLQYLATHDGLTGLANRQLLLDRLRQATAMARRASHLVALLLLDLNQFKVINDSLGHPVGDALLKAVAQRLRAAMRETDTVARLGGDEFVVLLPRIARTEEAAHVAQKILAALSDPFAIQTRELHVGASIGIALYPQDGGDDELLKSADLAMYHAKQEGLGRSHFYSEEMNRRNLRHMELEDELRHALERGELSLVYQPKFNLRTQQIEGAEALLRWHHPRLGRIPPVEFIPLAEETGLIMGLGEWVMQTACAQNRAWQAAGLPALTVSVNLSARQFRDSDLADAVQRVLERTGLPPECLALELTETALVQHMKEAAATLSRLKAAGVRLSLDDFGTGYSSLNYLRHFPFDTLKLDRSFTNDLASSSRARVLTRAVITLAHELELSVVAEGIETEAQLEVLRAHGCDKGQGYHLSLPLVPQEFFAVAMATFRPQDESELAGAQPLPDVA